MAVGTLSGRMLLRVVDFCAARGVDEQTLLRGTELTRGTLQEADARVSYELVERVGARALSLTGDDTFGLHLAQDVARQSQVDAGLLLLMASPTLGSAIERMVRYQRFWGDGDRAKLVALPDGVVLRYELRAVSGSYGRHADECALAEIAIGLRALSGQPVTARAVRFRHPPPPSLELHRALFGCPMTFGAAHSEVEFDAETCALPMQHAHAVFVSIFQHQVERAIGRLPAAARASAQVRAAVRTALASGRCNLAATARGLGVSARTLQRQLASEGTAFAQIIDVLRRELASAYLERGLAIPQVAELLGYASASAFHHAFRRWTGETPRRRAGRGASPPRPPG